MKGFLLFAVTVFVLGLSFSAEAQYDMAESPELPEEYWSLPVTLSSFTAQVVDGEVTLRWRTESEVNNLGFYIYHSESKGGPFVRVNDAMIPGAGNSAIYHEYEYTDKDVEAGRRYFYYIEDVDVSGMKNRSKIIEVFVPIVLPKKIPKEFALFQNFPNPFNPETWIPYQLAKDSEVTIRIYNVFGQLINTLSLGEKEAGRYINKDEAAYWNGKNGAGEPVASSMYFYTIQAGEFSATRRMVILK